MPASNEIQVKKQDVNHHLLEEEKEPQTGISHNVKNHQAEGQPIRTDGPESHLVTKVGTPTMGGTAIVGATTIGFVVALFLHLLLPEDKEEEEEEDSGKEMKVDPVEA